MSGDRSGLRRTPSLKRNVRIEVNSSGFSGRVSNIIRQNGANFSAKNLQPPGKQNGQNYEFYACSSYLSNHFFIFQQMLLVTNIGIKNIQTLVLYQESD